MLDQNNLGMANYKFLENFKITVVSSVMILLGIIMSYKGDGIEGTQSFFIVTENYKLISPLIHNTETGSRIECAMTCNQMPRCKSASFQEDIKMCQLHADYGCNIIPVNDWTLMSKKFDVLHSCKAYIDAGRSTGNGYYDIFPKCGARDSCVEIVDPMRVYCDQESNGGGWMRLYYKDAARTCSKYSDITWTSTSISCFGLITEISDLAISDDVTTISTQGSWLLLDASWSMSNAQLANLANCKTPSGTEWTDSYADGYVSFSGTLATNGAWSTTFIGCTTSYKSVGETWSVRTGGVSGHTGEFFHTACNDYYIKPEDNRVTSKWSDSYTRALWVRTTT